METGSKGPDPVILPQTRLRNVAGAGAARVDGDVTRNDERLQLGNEASREIWDEASRWLTHFKITTHATAFSIEPENIENKLFFFSILGLILKIFSEKTFSKIVTNKFSTQFLILNENENRKCSKQKPPKGLDCPF